MGYRVEIFNGDHAGRASMLTLVAHPRSTATYVRVVQRACPLVLEWVMVLATSYHHATLNANQIAEEEAFLWKYTLSPPEEYI